MTMTMEEAKLAELQLLSELEDWSGGTVASRECALTSIAISLKRIADAAERYIEGQQRM